MQKVSFNCYEIRLYITTYQIGGEVQGDTWTGNGTDRHIYLIGYTHRPLVIDITHPIVMGFSWIRIQLDLWWGK